MFSAAFRRPIQGAVAAGDAAAASSLLTGLVAYWTLNEASAGAGAVSRADSLGVSTLTDNNTTPSAAGKVGNAASFASANSEYLSCDDNAALSMGDIDFTISAWGYIGFNSGGHVLICKGGAGTDLTKAEYWIRPLMPGGGESIQCSVGNGTTNAVLSQAYTFAQNNWYHFVMWHDATANKIYVSINNAAALEQAYSGGSYDSAGTFTLGRWGDSVSNYWDGLIDEVGIWKRTLTPAERTALYNAGNGITYPFLGT